MAAFFIPVIFLYCVNYQLNVILFVVLCELKIAYNRDSQTQ